MTDVDRFVVKRRNLRIKVGNPLFSVCLLFLNYMIYIVDKTKFDNIISLSDQITVLFYAILLYSAYLYFLRKKNWNNLKVGPDAYFILTMIFYFIILTVFYFGDSKPIIDITKVDVLISAGVLLSLSISLVNIIISSFTYHETVELKLIDKNLTGHLKSSYLLVPFIIRKDIIIKPSVDGKLQISIVTVKNENKRIVGSLTEKELIEDDRKDRKYEVYFHDTQTNPDLPRNRILCDLTKSECLDFIRFLKNWSDLNFVYETDRIIPMVLG